MGERLTPTYRHARLVHPDSARAVGASRALGLVPTDQWPIVAACLIADGADGEDLAELASLSRSVSGWEVDQLLPAALQEAAVPDLTVSEAGVLFARLLAQAVRGRDNVPDHAIIRALGRQSPSLGYPSGVIGEAYYASEWLDCVCHRQSPERDEADHLEAQLRVLPALEVDDALIRALAIHDADAR